MAIGIKAKYLVKQGKMNFQVYQVSCLQHLPLHPGKDC